ncbi:MAG: hypothetical protein Q9N67_09635 [Ghiorsea sp.]|nr:hypothetical protein [Ghiorsea sp.]MDQ7005149.1 hypothetical protein [Ghiorsea sp.]
MKYLIILIFSFIILSQQGIAAEPQQKNKNAYQVVKSERSFFSSLWSRIQRIVPRNHTAKSTAVLGVRGAETTESALQPYWADDLTTDPSFRNDIKQFEDGTNLCESTTPEKGAEAFEQLLKTSESDMLKANTMIALASCYAEHGDEVKGRAQLQIFLQKYPKHPMHDEIESWLSANR